MRRIPWILALIVLSLAVAFGYGVVAEEAAPARKAEPSPNALSNPSMVQLIANPEKYHGRKVTLKGYLHVRFEGTAIYLSKDDAEHGIAANGLWVSFDRQTIPSETAIGPKEFDKKYVLIEGTFNKDRRGHMSAWQGAVESVNRIYELKRHE